MEKTKEIHAIHSSYGYHAIAALIRRETGLLFSDNIIHKCCKFLNIRSQMKHYKVKYKKSDEEHTIYPNVISNNWNTSKPLEAGTPTDNPKIL